MTIALTVLVLVLVGVLAAWMAALVTQRAAMQRLLAASRALEADPLSVAEPEPGGLDAALDHLEQSVAQAVERRSRVASAEDRLSWALGAIGHGVVIFDERGEVVYRNDPAASFLGARHSDALVEEAISTLAADALRGRRVERELELFGPPRRMLSVRAVPLADPARPSGVLVAVEDTSERRRLENVRRDFVANISHELKTPVGALALLAEAVQDASDDPEAVRRFAARMQQEAGRLTRPVQEIIDLSRLQYDDPVDSPDLVEIDDVVAAAIDRSRVDAENRHIRLASGGHPGLQVLGNEAQLIVALSNLVENAVAYSEPHTRVAVGVRRRGDQVEISVTDQGLGIPEGELGRIFERFYRVDPARSRTTGGTGLGLSIVKHVAASHGGEVTVWSARGSGSTFTLRLPLHPHPERPGQSSEPTAAIPEATP